MTERELAYIVQARKHLTRACEAGISNPTNASVPFQVQRAMMKLDQIIRECEERNETQATQNS